MDDPPHRTNLDGTDLDEATRLRLLVDAVVDYAIYMLDATGRVASWNAGARRIKGWTAEEILGQHVSRFHTDEDRRAGLPERALETAAREGRFETEAWRLRKDGSRFWANVVIDAIRAPDGRLIGYAKVTRDITDRAAAQAALRASEERFRLLVQGVTDYAIYLLDPEGHVVNWNAGAERFKGYTTDEILGQHFSRFYTEEDRATQLPRRALETALREGRFEQEGWRVRKDGGRFWASVVIDPIRDERGTLVGFGKVTRDMTERRRAQQELERTREALFQSQKMEAVGQLAAGVAHEFNNLLQVVRTRVELMRRRPSGVDGGEDAAIIRRTLQRAEDLTAHLLSVTGRRRLEPSRVALRDWLPSCTELLRPFMGGDAEIDLAVAGDLWDVQVDPGELESALLNVASNARDAMPAGGRLRIRACNERMVGAGDDGTSAREFVVLSVSDDGQGIDPEVLPRVFEPFFTTKEPGKGTGLGLSQVYGFARRSGGTVAIESAPGRGTTITLRLPRASPEAARPPADGEAPPPADAVPDGSGALVMVVDDHEDVARATGALLESLGYTVCYAASGPAALERLQLEPQPRAVVSDVVMPGALDGIEMARRARARWPKIPVILCTGYSAQVQQAAAEGFTILAKPYDFEALERTLRDALALGRVIPFARRT
ncbi:MAG TPA: PAS domain S-box protein [Burkholderiaceae bacterium]|nr:PAS domain S-box protein [Burkholderiaceae bacterium]